MESANQNEIIRQALFSDETEGFRIPAEPEEGDVVTLRFRTARNNIDHVFYQEAEGEETPLLKAASAAWRVVLLCSARNVGPKVYILPKPIAATSPSN